MSEIKAYLQNATKHFYLYKLSIQMEKDFQENQISEEVIEKNRQEAWDKYKDDFLKNIKIK